MRYPFTGYDSMNGGGYPFPNPAAAVGAMGGVHSTTPHDHPPVSHGQHPATPHSTDSSNHLSKPESSEVH